MNPHAVCEYSKLPHEAGKVLLATLTVVSVSYVPLLSKSRLTCLVHPTP